MGDRKRRTPKKNEPKETKVLTQEESKAVNEATPDQLREAITKAYVVGDGLPGPDAMDKSRVSKKLHDQDEGLTDDQQKFIDQYESTAVRGTGYLQRRRVTSNRTGLIPPNCEIHPDLGLWGLRYAGKWMIIRWIAAYQKNRQKRYDQGWQYFEGTEWFSRLGLDPNAFPKNEKGRVQFGDVELAWHTEEYAYMNRKESAEAQADMISEAQQKYLGSENEYVKNLEIIKGSDDDVMREIRERKRYAGTRS